MAVAVRGTGPTVGKSKYKFFCPDCQIEKEGWPYGVGVDGEKREICSLCWAARRLPPMKPIGLGFSLDPGLRRTVRWDEEAQDWVDVT